MTRKVTYGLDYYKRDDGILVLRRAAWYHAARSNIAEQETKNVGQSYSIPSHRARRKPGQIGRDKV
jgi:hypothetical protein